MGGDLSAPALPNETLFPLTKTARPDMDELEAPGAGAEDGSEGTVVEEPPSVSAWFLPRPPRPRPPLPLPLPP